MRNSIPANYNVFEQFDRVIISVDTLKGNQAYANALENCRWDLVIIDEAHNVAERSKATYGSVSQRAELAQLSVKYNRLSAVANCNAARWQGEFFL